MDSYAEDTYSLIQMPEKIIFTKMHHGGYFSEIPVPTYVGESELASMYMDNDHFSITELEFYTKEIGFVSVEGFYYQNSETKQFHLVESDLHLLDLIKDLKHGDNFEIWVKHVVDHVLPVDEEGPTGYLTGENENLLLNNRDGESFNLQEVVVEEAVESLGGNCTGVLDVESHLSEVESSDSDLEDIPEEDDSDVDEELRTLRQDKRNKK